MTFTTTKAPIGEWRFGTLEWEGSGYDVRSPIAVRAAQLEAPAVVTGTGLEGSVEIPIAFGYSGPYTAGAHGLVAATLTTDVVLQDPDQLFDPDDGFSDQVEIEVSGGSVLRVAMPPEATEAEADIDLYLEDPAGNIVAASTSGGTDEEIVVEDPADGTWILHVHGWQTIGPDSPYTLFSWVVADATGPTLTATGPTEAVSGTTAIVVASWTGATLGEWHFGAVSHNDGDGVIQRTMVDVDNR